MRFRVCSFRRIQKRIYIQLVIAGRIRIYPRPEVDLIYEYFPPSEAKKNVFFLFGKI